MSRVRWIASDYWIPEKLNTESNRTTLRILWQHSSPYLIFSIISISTWNCITHLLTCLPSMSVPFVVSLTKEAGASFSAKYPKFTTFPGLQQLSRCLLNQCMKLFVSLAGYVKASCTVTSQRLNKTATKTRWGYK